MVRKVVSASVKAGVYLCAPCKRGNELLFERRGLPQARSQEACARLGHVVLRVTRPSPH
jgi:hypothetical protein